MAVHSNRVHPVLEDIGGPLPSMSQLKTNEKVTWFCAMLEDEYRCLLTGITCIRNYIVVCDNENKNIKKFSFTGKFISSLTLKDPCGICNIPKSEEVIVTEPDEHQIVFCTVDGDPELTSEVKTIKKYECIAVLDEVKLVVGCCEIGAASVDVIDYNGSVLKSIQRREENMWLFRNPAAITCLNSGEILVSDAGRSVLICISPQGEVEFTYDPSGRPSGLCVDPEGGIFMAQYDAHSVFRLSSEGVKESVIVGSGCDIKSPLALSVMEGALALTEEMPSDRIILIKIPHSHKHDRQLTNVSLSSVRMWLHQSPRSSNLQDIPDT